MTEIAQRADPWRWAVMFAFGSINFANGSAYTIFSPIISESQTYFGVGYLPLTMFVNVWPIAYLLFSVPVLWLLLKWPLSRSLALCAVLNTAGSWIRFAAQSTYWLNLFGATIVAISQLWSLPAPALLIEYWFPPSERVLVVSVSMGTSIIGSSFGYLIAANIVNCGSQCTKDALAPQFHDLLLYNAIWMSVPLLLTLALVRDAPRGARPAQDAPSAVSDAQAAGEGAPKQTFKESLKSLFARRRTWVNLTWTAMLIGLAWSFLALVAKILEPLKLTVMQNGWVGLVMNAAGAIGAVTASIGMEKSLEKRRGAPNYDVYIKSFLATSFALSLVMTGVMAQHAWRVPMALVYVLCALIGLGQNAAIPFISQAFIEDVYPTNQITAFNALFYFPQASTFLINLLTSVGLWVIDLVALPFIVYVLFFYKTHTLRYEAECQKQLLANGDGGGGGGDYCDAYSADSASSACKTPETQNEDTGKIQGRNISMEKFDAEDYAVQRN